MLSMIYMLKWYNLNVKDNEHCKKKMANYFLEIEYEKSGDHARENLTWCRFEFEFP